MTLNGSNLFPPVAQLTVYIYIPIGDTGAGCNTVRQFLPLLPRKGKQSWFHDLNERVICQLDFPLALKFHTHVVLENDALKQPVKCCNMPHITGSVVTLPWDNCNTMF